MFKFSPAVFAVKDNYQIMVRCDEHCMMWVKVGDKCYYDDVNGILRSETNIHKMVVPIKALDEAKSYTVCERKIIERKPYYTETEDVKEYVYNFKPVSGDNVRAYHIADAHNLTKQPVNAAKAFGEFDFLILNGDIPDHSGDTKNFDNIYKICSDITEGEMPIVFSRGNHDMRGVYAEKFADYTPTDKGNSFFTFRLGSVWGLVLDCGEDKLDSSIEYGNTICCHAFRERETEFIKSVVQSGEYNEEGITHKIIISHHPFFYKQKEDIFVIETDIYTEWCKLIKDNIKPELSIHGHLHMLAIEEPGGALDFFGQPCMAVVGSNTNMEDYVVGAGITLSKSKPEITFTDSKGEIVKL